MFCSNCGKVIAEEAKYCKHCGFEQRIIKKEISIVTKSPYDYENNDNPNVRNSTDSNGSINKATRTTIVLVGLLLIGFLALIFNTHTCDWCGKTFLGEGYYDAMDPGDRICKDCAKKYYQGFGIESFRY